MVAGGSEVSWLPRPHFPDSSLPPPPTTASSSSASSHSIPSHLPDPLSPSSFAFTLSQSSQSGSSTPTSQSVVGQSYPVDYRYLRDGTDQSSTTSQSVVPISVESVESASSSSQSSLQDSHLPCSYRDSYQPVVVGSGASESALTLEQRRQANPPDQQPDDPELYRDTVV